MRAERSEKRARRPSAFVLFVILGAHDELGYSQYKPEVPPTSFSRRASSASVCGGTYFAETRRRTLIRTARLPAAPSRSASTCTRVSGRLFVLCPVYASLRRTASLYSTRSDALAAHRFNAPRTTALVLANADARVSSSSASTVAAAAGALPLPLFKKLFFPFRIDPADASAAVGDAISTSCGDGRGAPPLLRPAAFGESSGGSGCEGPDCLGGAGKSATLGNLDREGRAEIGGEGSDANEPFADITSGLRISGSERDCTEGQPNRLFEDFCFVGGLKDVPVGVPGREIGCILGGGGCWGVPLASEELSPGRAPCADCLNPSTMVGWRSIDGCLVEPFKDGADWLVVKLAGCLLEAECEVCGDVLMGGRIGRVGVVDVAPRGLDGDEPKIPAVGFVSACTGVVDDDDGAPNGCPGEKAFALGLRKVAVGGVEPALRLISGTLLLLGNPNGAL